MYCKGFMVFSSRPVDFSSRPVDSTERDHVQPVCPAASESLKGASSLYRYVTERDLAFFERHCESDQPLEGATKWELQMDKEFPTFTYTAWRRILPVSSLQSNSVLMSYLLYFSLVTMHEINLVK